MALLAVVLFCFAKTVNSLNTSSVSCLSLHSHTHLYKMEDIRLFGQRGQFLFFPRWHPKHLFVSIKSTLHKEWEILIYLNSYFSQKSQSLAQKAIKIEEGLTKHIYSQAYTNARGWGGAAVFSSFLLYCFSKGLVSECGVLYWLTPCAIGLAIMSLFNIPSRQLGQTACQT